MAPGGHHEICPHLDHPQCLVGRRRPELYGILRYSHFDLDEHGWLMRVPVEDIPGTEAPQIVLTVWANTSVPSGRAYTLLYEGEGEIVLQWDAQVIAEEPGRMEVQVTPGWPTSWPWRSTRPTRPTTSAISASSCPAPRKPIREQIWCAEWMDKLAPSRPFLHGLGCF